LISRCHKTLLRATRSQHRALDQHPCLRILVSGNVTEPLYIECLARLHRGFAIVESPLLEFDASSAPDDAVLYTPQLAAIENDLRALSAPVYRLSFGVIPIESSAYHLGMRYVLEGSARGAVHIARAITYRLPDIAEQAFEFWSIQKRESKRWEPFLQRLAELDRSRSEGRKAVSGARAAFDAFLHAVNTLPKAA